jgi:hypothetical protein
MISIPISTDKGLGICQVIGSLFYVISIDTKIQAVHH